MMVRASFKVALVAAFCTTTLTAASSQDATPEVIAPGIKTGPPFSAGVTAFDRGEYDLARKIWLPWAHKGDPAAQRNMAHLYRMGLGVPQDFVQAASWYRLAADRGLARAQANLAAMYLRGQGLEEDAREAAYWFTAAATNGHVLAQYNLGLLYLRGEGVERNEAKAAGWLYRAGKAGYQPAMRVLGRLVTIISGPAGPPHPPPPSPPTSPPTLASTPTAVKPDPVATTGNTAEASAPAANSMPNKVAGDAVLQKPETAADAAKAEPADGGTFWQTLTSLFSDWPETGNASDPEIEVDSLRETQVQRDLAAGLVALHTENFASAKKRWEPLAETGHAEAQYQLGKLYLRPGFAEASKPHGFYWLDRAAGQKHAGAKVRLDELEHSMTDRERAAARALSPG